ncbi:aminotransferase class V-fold PLP-dependent enzyme [Streptomyces sp. TLI_171]|uniref:pyridoxal phosphate-dependent decarboxylase family protein n=1 Tax=Streptomyces sp. TLI_171 TaxID=1938859 RepID=UPI000C196198|nr:aminotransferase class V-fold PLP-dependent enzyme [Streptomyces sp. TLI_171]RKE18788.1 glutamate/tyrosine decarboxylase-like PLP-dependent enzyme [Streptomyces sp. TLI_171]
MTDRHPALPDAGRTADELLAELRALTAGDLPTRGGRTTAYTYDAGRPEVREAAERAYLAMLDVNGLDPTAFPSIVALERRVVGAVAERLGGDHATPGIFTSGGTESVLLAVKAARDARPGIAEPEIVVPATAHAAFFKAGSYLKVKVVTVPVDPRTFRAAPAAMAAACTERTVLVVASAPSYAHGVVDPVTEIAADAAARGIPCHVDACVGGWLLPWLAEAGATVPPFDLAVPGVTSLSCDLHKFGYAPKGASVLLFRDRPMRLAAYFACAQWPGYPVVNSTVQSSKGAGPLAGAWATLQALGADGYRELGRSALAATRRLIAGVAGIDGLRVLGAPDATLVALGAADPELDLWELADESRARGFFLQPQLSVDGLPASLHVTLTGVSEHGVDALLAALRDSVAAVRDRGPVAPPTEILALLDQLDFSLLDDAAFAALLPAAGLDLSPTATPRMAGVNRLLDGLPPHRRNQLATRFLSALYSPHLEGN